MTKGLLRTGQRGELLMACPFAQLSPLLLLSLLVLFLQYGASFFSPKPLLASLHRGRSISGQSRCWENLSFYTSRAWFYNFLMGVHVRGPIGLVQVFGVISFCIRCLRVMLTNEDLHCAQHRKNEPSDLQRSLLCVCVRARSSASSDSSDSFPLALATLLACGV